MRWPVASRSVGVYIALTGVGLSVCVWQWGEHRRFEQTTADALIHRGRDITSTLGVVVRSQRRYGGVVSKDRFESALQDLVRPGELESIVVLGATGETIASAGRPLEITAEMLRARGVFWRDHSLMLMNLMDLGSVGSAGPEDHTRPVSTIVVPDPRAFRPGQTRRQTEARTGTDGATTKAGETAAATPSPRSPFGRPSWMSKDEYESVIQKQGMHSLVIALSTDEMHRAVENDLLLRVLVSGVVVTAALISGLAWRNVRKNAELQLRLVKAGEMNTHLTEMNFAAAGLAHETRNPLNLIRGHAHLIAQTETSPKLKDHAANIIEEADRVTVQLNEFINYSKPREAHPGPVDVPRLVADIARTLQPDIEEKQIKLRATETPLVIAADEPLLRQAIFNLLLNAVQAVGQAGQIWVDWSISSARAATLEIRDDGPGVPAAERTAIFKPYVTMRPKGVGLGLAIVHQIVSVHGWEILCDANQPRGAVFRIGHVKLAAAQPA